MTAPRSDQEQLGAVGRAASITREESEPPDMSTLSLEEWRKDEDASADENDDTREGSEPELSQKNDG